MIQWHVVNEGDEYVDRLLYAEPVGVVSDEHGEKENIVIQLTLPHEAGKSPYLMFLKEHDDNGVCVELSNADYMKIRDYFKAS